MLVEHQPERAAKLGDRIGLMVVHEGVPLRRPDDSGVWVFDDARRADAVARVVSPIFGIFIALRADQDTPGAMKYALGWCLRGGERIDIRDWVPWDERLPVVVDQLVDRLDVAMQRFDYAAGFVERLRQYDHGGAWSLSAPTLLGHLLMHCPRVTDEERTNTLPLLFRPTSMGVIIQRDEYLAALAVLGDRLIALGLVPIAPSELEGGCAAPLGKWISSYVNEIASRGNVDERAHAGPDWPRSSWSRACVSMLHAAEQLVGRSHDVVDGDRPFGVVPTQGFIAPAQRREEPVHFTPLPRHFRVFEQLDTRIELLGVQIAPALRPSATPHEKLAAPPLGEWLAPHHPAPRPRERWLSCLWMCTPIGSISGAGSFYVRTEFDTEPRRQPSVFWSICASDGQSPHANWGQQRYALHTESLSVAILNHQRMTRR